MRLEELIEGSDVRLEHGPATTPVRDLTDDSRQVTPGTAFIARAGTQTDGRAFIQDAIDRGAAAIITTGAVAPESAPVSEPTRPRHVAWATCANIDQFLAGRLAERFFGQPSRKLRLIGVTGTNGKTTTALLIGHLLRRAGVPTGLMGTLFTDVGPGATAGGEPGSKSGDKSGGEAGAGCGGGPGGGTQVTPLTTPGAIDLSRYLARMVENGCRAAVAEVSSHALDQGRTAALDFEVAVFTNLSGDHLDYHPSMEAYAAAKAVLFEQLGEQGWAVLNADDPNAERIAGCCKARRLWTHIGDVARDAPRPGCQAVVCGLGAEQSRARFDGPWGNVEVCLPLVGRHNVSNALQAAAAAHCIVNLTGTLRSSLATCPPIPGRLERVTCGAAAASDPIDSSAGQETPNTRQRIPTVLVDYAHTHDALENVLRALRPLARGRLIVLFGCGGDRDRTKRPKMAAAACRLADRLFITSDNPRTEDPEAIIADILTGVRSHKRVEVITDRAEAIHRCVLSAEPADTVLLAGKGHEDYQIIGTATRHFDDREQAAAALDAWVQRRMAPCRSPGLSI